MRKFAIVCGICTSLVLGAALFASAQDEHRDERQATAPQERQQNRQDQARPADQQNTEHQNQNQDRPNMNRPAENRQGQDRQTQQQRDTNREQGRTNVERQNQERQNQRQQQEMHPNDNRQNGREVYQGRRDQARPEGQARGERERNARRIPDDDFRAHFGREHRFAPGHTRVYEGRPQFFYSGYAFQLLEPWPSDGSYDEDDCYVDYDDGGYWLYNYRYPGERVTLMLVQ